MRKEYKSPEMELVEMNNNDIITTSGFDNNNLMDELAMIKMDITSLISIKNINT